MNKLFLSCTEKNIINSLKDIKNVEFFEPLKTIQLESLLSEHHLSLPTDHVELLKETDGLSCFDGYFRLFGVSESKLVNLFSWNHKDLWKFSWENSQLNTFLFFGETAWGDQYAYKIDSVTGKLLPEIYEVEAITMKSEIIADNFCTFLNDEMLRNAQKPYDETLINAHAKFGKLPFNEHLIYIPSILVTGNECLSDIKKMDAVTSMIINGDLCRQLALEPQSKRIKKLESYVDNKGRNRIMVEWFD